MKKNKCYELFCCLIACFAISFCGEGAPLINMQIIASSGSSTEVGNALGVDQGEVLRAIAVFDEIEFQVDEECPLPTVFVQVGEEEVIEQELGDGQTDILGPIVADMLAKEYTPEITPLSLDAANYCELEVKLGVLEPSELPEGISPDQDIVGSSFIMAGLDENQTPFVIDIDEDITLDLTSFVGGFEFENNQSYDLLLDIDVDVLINAVDVSTLLQTSGTIYINQSSNEAAYLIIRDKLRQAATLILDVDGDGVVGGQDIALAR